MRSDDLSRPIQISDTPRIPGRTLHLSGEYLRLSRLATAMRKKTFWVFKKYRAKRRDRYVQQIDGRATDLWEELYLRYRPLISAALVRGGVAHDNRRARTEAVTRLIRDLELKIEERDTDNCFAGLLWDAVTASARLEATSITALQKKFHFRAILDECDDDVAANTIEMTCFLRGEVCIADQQTIPLTDLEIDKLTAACAAVSYSLENLGVRLDSLTGGVLTNAELLRGRGKTVESWIQ